MSSCHLRPTTKKRTAKTPQSNKRFKPSSIYQSITHTTVECLPNELIYRVFSYLTDKEIFFSFNKLTKSGRFDRLIRTRTSINLRSVPRSLFLRYKSLIKPTVIRQLHLFNDDDTPGIINEFFSLYSITSLPNLQNLVLDQPEQKDLINLMKSFPYLHHLSIRLSRLVRMPAAVYTNLYSSISSDRLKSLTIVDDPEEPIVLPEHLSLPNLLHLTLGSLTIFDVQKLLQSAPQLRSFKFHLNVDQSNIHFEQNSIPTKITRAYSLPTGRVYDTAFDLDLEIDAPRAEFHLIEKLLRPMWNLKALKLSCRGVNASVWECFIKGYLPNLIDFRFKFDSYQRNVNLTEYQRDWWTKDKRWIVVAHPLSSVFYTVPLIDSKFILNTRTALRQENVVSSKLSNEYANIDQLLFALNPLGFILCQKDQIYFPSVHSLTLIDYQNSQKPVAHLTQLINLQTVRHLTIDHQMRASTFLLLVKEMPSLNSIAGSDRAFAAITKKFQNEKVISFLQSNIKRLTINPSQACNDLRYVSQLCVVFAHIHQLTLTIKSASGIWPWLRNLFDLHSATIFCRYGSFIDLIDQKWFLKCTYELRSHQDLRLWIR